MGPGNLFLSPPNSVRCQMDLPVRALGNQIASSRKLLQPVLCISLSEERTPNSDCAMGRGPKAALSPALAQGPHQPPISVPYICPDTYKSSHATLPAMPHNCDPMAVPKASLTLDPCVPALVPGSTVCFFSLRGWTSLSPLCQLSP